MRLQIGRLISNQRIGGRVRFVKPISGEIFHQIYKGDMSNEKMYGQISDTLTLMTTGGDINEK